MTETGHVDRLKAFLETKPASQKAIRHLKKGVEIAIVVGREIECAYFQENGQPRLERRAAEKPDVIFVIKPEAVDTLCSHPGEDVGDFGIAVLKQYIEGNVRLKAPGSLLALGTHGYLGIMKEGGPTFTKFLATRGVKSLGKVFSIVKSLRDS